MYPTEPTASLPVVVLDTNAALDWLVFDDAGMTPLSRAIQEGRVRWVACLRMRDELERTLAYSSLSGRKPDCVRTLTLFDLWASPRPTPDASRFGPLICSDPDDQVFIDLAVAQGARWLVTQDRALLKLRRRASECGVSVLRPKEWPGHRVGGGVTPAVLPQHRTCGSAYGAS